jgi:phage tail protein X
MRHRGRGVGTLNWNTAAETSACVRALLRSDYRRVRIVIVDNNSADDSVAVLRQRFPTAIVVALPGISALRLDTSLPFSWRLSGRPTQCG